MAEPAPSGDVGPVPRGGHSGLLEFAAAAKTGDLPSPDVKLSDELEGIIREVAKTGATNGYPWDSLRQLLAQKVEIVLGDFWREVPDVPLQEGETFEATSVEPLRLSLLEPQREGPPFTVQRLCELLAEPRNVYKSTRKYLYAVQRAILVNSTEEAVLAVHKMPEVVVDLPVVTSEPVPAEVASPCEGPAEVPPAASKVLESLMERLDRVDTVLQRVSHDVPAVTQGIVDAVTAGAQVEAAAVDTAVDTAGSAVEPTASTGPSSQGSPGGDSASRKRKLPPELSNGVVE